MLAIELAGTSFIVTLNQADCAFWQDPRTKVCLATSREWQISLDLTAEMHNVDIISFPCQRDFELTSDNVVPILELLLLFQSSSNWTEQFQHDRVV